jgi:membrane-associated phospholipid phosphatase
MIQAVAEHFPVTRARSYARPLYRPSVILCALVAFAVMAALSLLQLRGFDYSILRAFNSVSQRYYVLDHGINDFTRLMFANLLIVSLVWYAWFKTEDTGKRATILVGTVMSLGAAILSRVLQHALPTHSRPLHDTALNFVVPLSVDPSQMNHWFSFPSDHVAIFFGLATTVYLIDKRIGWLAYILAGALSLARIYLGFHCPTDVVAGAALGMLMIELTRGLANTDFVRRLVPRPGESRPAFYAVAFYFCFGLTQLFTDPREVMSGVAHYLHHVR